MAYKSFGLNDPLTNKLFEKMLHKSERETMDIAPLMSTSNKAIIHVKDETSKSAGDKVTFGLKGRLTQRGILSTGTIAGNAEALSTYDDAIFIESLTCNVGAKSKFTIDAQRVPFDMRTECKESAAEWWVERKAVTFFNHVCGYTPANTTGDGTGTEYTGNNTVLAAAGTSALVRQIWAGTAANDQSLGSSDVFALSMVDRAVEAARTGSRMIVPVRVGGKDKYIIKLSERQARQLRTSMSAGGWGEITKFTYSGVDVSKNPLYNGALGEWNRCIFKVSQDVSRGVNSSSGAAVTAVHRAVFLGRQAACVAFGRRGFGPSKYRWNEELEDHKTKLEVSAMSIWGLKKAQFNSVDHGALVMSSHDGS